MTFNQYTIQDFLNDPHRQIHFHIDRLENQIQLPKNVLSPHKHLFHELFFVESGEISHIVDFKEFTAGENTLSFITQGQLHFRGENKGAIKGFRLMFDADFFWALQPYHQFLFDMVHLGNIYHSPKIKIILEKQPKLKFYFENLYSEYQQPHSELALGSLLYLLLLEIQRQLDDANINTRFEQNDLNLFRKFTDLVEKNFRQSWSMQQYADALQISISKLNKTVHLITNDSVLNIAHNRSILEAKRLLTFSDLTISEIAFSLGIQDTSYFARFFRKFEGVSPKEFRSNTFKMYR